ncbi:hypothetical protein [Neorhizobium huautlense]|uniref:hypothetical protein n=1 Tax=Neorhizobium huautlense TaxID=67774 RepID=UPI000CF86563|nr:hypothetical protein [Neorhizobium huautlense]
MPSYSEVRLYLSGLWLLIRGDAQGFRLLDVSDRGMMRSFWAFVWCLPAVFVSWIWLRSLLVQSMPPGTRLGGMFFVRVAMLEVLNWLLPIVFSALICLFMGIHRKFPAIVVTINWLAVPFAWIYGLLCLAMLLLPVLTPIIGLMQLMLLMILVFAVSRIMRMICGPQLLMTTALVLVLLVPNMILTGAMQRFLGIYPF